MSISRSPLRKNIANITSKPPKRAYKLTTTVHTTYGKLLVEHINSMDIIRDYVNSVSDKYVIKFGMFLGDYLKHILPSKDLMEADLTWKYGKEEVYTRRYRVVLQLDANNKVNSEQFGIIHFEELNKKSMIEVTMELTDVSVEPLLVVKADSGIYNGAPKSILRALISSAIDKITIKDGDVVDFVSVIDPNVTSAHKEVLIKSNTLLQAMPTYINNKYGVYTSAIGTYIQRTIIDNKDKLGFYCYPMYNTYRLREKTLKLAIVVSNTMETDMVKTTYFKDDDTVRILASNVTSDLDHRSSTDTREYATRANNEDYFNVDRTSSANVVITKKDYSSAVNHQERKDKVSPVRYKQKDKNVNMTELISNMSSGFGDNVVVKWTNSNPWLLYPGMPVAILTATMEGTVKSRTGVLLGNHTVATPVMREGKTFYVNTTVLMLKLNNVPE